MIEYIFDVIRASAGEEIVVKAQITDDNGAEVTSGCHLMLYDDLLLLATVDGVYRAESKEWVFTIHAEDTAGLKGRYWYCICEHGTSLCFKRPIYLI